MKKILLILVSLFLVGCNTNMNSPSRKVEEFLAKYQTLDDDVLTQLQVIVDNDSEMNSDEKKEYIALMQKQYQNLSYKITDEDINDDKAVVEVEAEVYDYSTSINKSKEYFSSHKDELVEDDDEIHSYIDYKIKEMKNVEDRITYVITFYLKKDKKNKWVVEDLSESDIKKLHGLY